LKEIARPMNVSFYKGIKINQTGNSSMIRSKLNNSIQLAKNTEGNINVNTSSETDNNNESIIKDCNLNC